MIWHRFGQASIISAIDAALASAQLPAEVPLLLVGDVRLARALASAGRTVTTVAQGKAARRAPGVIEELPAARSVKVLVGADGASDPATLAAWRDVVEDNGLLVLIDRSPPNQLTRAALLTGLCEIEQRAVGRARITSGLVTAW